MKKIKLRSVNKCLKIAYYSHKLFLVLSEREEITKKSILFTQIKIWKNRARIKG